MRYQAKKSVRRWAFLLGFFAALSACLPFNQPLPPTTPTVKAPSPLQGASRTPLPLTAMPILPTITLTPATPSATPTPACLFAPGQTVKGIIETKLLPKPMSYFVYLPPCYFENANTRYPVLYLLHGQTYTEDQWIRLGVPTVMDGLIATGEIPPFIIVFPYDYSYLQPTQYKFEDVFMQTLLPEVDATYRTLPTSSHRAVGGLSRGAAWALHLGINHPDVFGTIGAHSPAMFYTDGVLLPITLQNIPIGLRPRLYIDMGDEDGELENNRNFKNFLDEHLIPYEWHEYIGFHDEKYWGAHVETYLRWYANGWVKK